MRAICLKWRWKVVDYFQQPESKLFLVVLDSVNKGQWLQTITWEVQIGHKGEFGWFWGVVCVVVLPPRCPPPLPPKKVEALGNVAWTHCETSILGVLEDHKAVADAMLLVVLL